MAEFTEVMRQALRMCDEIADCDQCPLMDTNGCRIDPATRTASEVRAIDANQLARVCEKAMVSLENKQFIDWHGLHYLLGKCPTLRCPHCGKPIGVEQTDV